MNSRLLPLVPPHRHPAAQLVRLAMPRLALISMPWFELGVFALMVVGLIRLST